MFVKFILYAAIFTEVAVLGWLAHDITGSQITLPSISLPTPAPTPVTRIVVVQQPPDPFANFDPSSGHLIQEQQRGCYDVRDNCSTH